MDKSTIEIYGTDFEIDGQPVGYGELTNIFGGSIYGERPRQLTGMLLSGETINNWFQIDKDARIVLIPEPASALLMTLGTVILTLRRRKR